MVDIMSHDDRLDRTLRPLTPAIFVTCMPSQADHFFYFLNDLLGDLESEDLVLELAHGPCLLEAQAFSRLLQSADHRRRPAKQDLNIVRSLGQPFL